MRSIKQLPLDDLNGLDLLPLACNACAADRIGTKNGIRFEREFDDLDEYDISALEFADTLAGPLVFAVRTYRGGPRDAVDVLLPAELRGSSRLRAVVRDIARALHVPVGRVTWPAAANEAAKRDRDQPRRAS